jgi:hypothetical protein
LALWRRKMTAKDNESAHIHVCSVRCEGAEVPGKEELAALNAMRAIKARGKHLKKRLAEIESSSRQEDREAARALEVELERLRRKWKEWEKKREEATRQRMILLGHHEYQ